ncbi:MAG: hypothetical protein NTV80_26395 [Verrucomicrobia bacterium]|nr:hypothetical protein [Verrucomicrobiota bacterium]
MKHIWHSVTLRRTSLNPVFWLVAACLLFTTTQPSSAATSSIVGWYSVTVPAGNSSWTCALVCADLYQSAAVTVSADPSDGKAILSFSAPGWTVGEFNRHYAEPLSGTSTGLAIDVLSNTTDTLKLDATPAGAGLTNGMVFVLRKHCTLGGLMPDGGGFLPFNDSIALFQPNGSQRLYFWNGANWYASNGANSNGVVIRPAQGFVIQANATLTLTLGKGDAAYVKGTPTRIRANSGVPNLIGALNPLGTTTTLGALGITGSLQPFNDSIVTLNAGTLAQTGTFLSTGSNLINGSGQNANNTALPAGTSIVISVDTSKDINLAPITIAP